MSGAADFNRAPLPILTLEVKAANNDSIRAMTLKDLPGRYTEQMCIRDSYCRLSEM